MNTTVQKPHEKMPEHLSTSKPATTKEEKIDAQMADSFPASDPPSFSGGNHIVGAPGRTRKRCRHARSSRGDRGRKESEERRRQATAQILDHRKMPGLLKSPGIF